MFNLRRDPFERADENSNTYYDLIIISHCRICCTRWKWLLHRRSKISYGIRLRQKPASLNLDAIMRQLDDAGGGAHH